ncbi:MAG: hypothetical protein ACI4HO_02290 [Ruminococcus sp.]
MAREKELFRANLDRLDERFPGQEVLKYADIANYLGRTTRFAQKHFGKFYNSNLAGISKTVLARELS